LKRWFHGWFGERAYVGWYRLLFNLFAVLTFLPLYLLVPLLLPQRVLWMWSRPYSYLALAIQLLGLAGLAYSLWVTNIWDFLGIRQVVWYLRGAKGDVPQPPLTTSGPYALVRHPLYSFTLLVLWFNPVMTVGSLIFYTAVTLYFWLGSIYEERKLAAGYGDAYRAYQQRVPRLIPLPVTRKPNQLTDH
jgi:protein-S-isoprenylcysteine O-methyltransferase Ste14